MIADSTTVVEEVYRSDWGRIVATLIGMVGDFELAEESAQEAFAAAVEQWATSGVPEFPRAWIIQTARHKAIDRIRHKVRTEEKLDLYANSGLVRAVGEPDYDTDEIPDDRLRLIFTCCHPALASEAQVALTLRTLCGLETDQIARAFLAPTTTMAQRLVRAKRWPQILRLYDLLERLQPSPIVSLNRAVAVAMVEGPEAGIALIDALAATGDLEEYHLLHAARADLLRRIGSSVEAAKSYRRALALVTNESERRFLERRLREVQPAA